MTGLRIAFFLLFLPGYVCGATTDQPFSSGFIAHSRTGDQIGYCALRHTEVAVAISGPIAEVQVTQVFQNTLPEAIEAIYVFPLPERAAVSGFEFKVGKRRVYGEIKEREEARRLYEEAMQQGRRAALLDQERPNIFTTSVANVMPGEEIEVRLRYLEQVIYKDSAYEFIFPALVGPRYFPGGNQVPDAARISPLYVPSQTRPATFAIRAEIAPGLPVREIHSEQHVIQSNLSADRTRATITLQEEHAILDRDFVLRYAVAREEIADSVLSFRRDGEGWFSLVLYPPRQARANQVLPKEMIFVIDCSGSMSGFPLQKAKETMRLCIENMNAQDTFNLISFAGGQGYCFDAPVLGTPENQKLALVYLENLESGGGTEMMGAVRAALGGTRSEERLRIVCFMTDGYVGNDLEILKEIQETADKSRLFSFGIGSSVNRFLIENMAKVGRGAAEIVTLETEGSAAATRFYQRVHSPVLTDVTVDFEGLEVSEVQPPPHQMPDLFSESPLVVTGRYAKTGYGAVVIRGKTPTGAYERRVPVELRRWSRSHSALAPLWARMRIETLMSQDYGGLQSGNPNAGVRAEIEELGLKYALTTPFTSFVAVDEVVANRGAMTRTQVPLGMPHGVSFEGAVGSPAVQAVQVSREIFVFSHVLFPSGSAALGETAKAEIDKVIQELQKNTADLVQIEGHTDDAGDDAVNMVLGQRRADAVRDYMVQQGVAPDRISTVSFGESQPAVPNDTEGNRKLNRRAVFRITLR